MRKGEKITTNNRNCFEVLDFNEFEVVVKDLLSGDCYILTISEYSISAFDPIIVLPNLLERICDGIMLSDENKEYILKRFSETISKIM